MFVDLEIKKSLLVFFLLLEVQLFELQELTLIVSGLQRVL